MTDRQPRADVVDAIVDAWRVELPEVAPLPLAVSKRVAWLFGLVDTTTQRQLDRLGRTKAEYEILARLRSTGAPYRCKPGELAGSLLLSSGGTTNVLHRLVGAGLVTRVADPDDRRSVWVQLTPEGVAAAEETVRTVGQVQKALIGRIDPGRAAELADLLREVLADLDDDEA